MTDHEGVDMNETTCATPTAWIPLDKGQGRALVDASDVSTVTAVAWRAQKGTHTSYAVGTLTPKRGILMHRLILGLGPDDPQVDHINRNGLDNRRSNLRLATGSNNRGNQAKVSSYAGRPCASEYKGVYWHKKNKRWVVTIQYRGRKKSLGCYGSEVEAAVAYDRAAVGVFGEFACLNFPDEEHL